MPPSTPFSNHSLDEYLRQQEQKDLLRFMTCGSVDDGKSAQVSAYCALGLSGKKARGRSAYRKYLYVAPC